MLSLLTVLCLCPAAHAAGNRPEMPPLESKVPGYNLDTKDMVFPSGLRVILQRDDSAPVVAISTVIDAGSTRDPAGKEGIAHLSEHLWFASSHNELHVQDVLFETGAITDAGTHPDYMTFTTLAPVASLPYLLSLESLRLTEPLNGIDESVFAATREIVSLEERYRYSTGWQSSRPAIFQRLFPEGHPYNGTGSDSMLSQLSLDDARAFVAKRFTPENTTLMVVGNIDLTDAASLIFDTLDPKLMHPDLTSDHVRSWARPGITDVDPDNPAHVMTWPLDPTKDDDMSLLDLGGEPTQRLQAEPPALPDPSDSRGVTTVTAPVKNPLVVVAWAVPGAYRGQESLIQVTTETLHAMVYTGFADMPGVVMASPGQPVVSCFNESHVEATLVACSVEVEPSANRERIASTVADQVSSLWNPDLRAQLQTKAQNGSMTAMTHILHSLDVVANLDGGRASVTARHAHFTGSPNYHSDTLQAISGSQAEDIGTFAHNFLQRNRAIFIAIEPLDATEVLNVALDGYHGAAFATAMGQVHDAIDADMIRNNFTTVDLSDLREKTLSNGLTVVALRHGEAPTVRANLVFVGGVYTPPLGMDSFSSQLQFRTLTAPEVTKNPLSVNAFYTQYEMRDWSVEGLKGASGNLDGLLWLLRDQMEEREPVLYFKNAYLRQLRSARIEQLHDPLWWAVDLENDHTLPGHPGQWRTDWEDLERLKLLGAADVRAYLAQKHQPSNTVLTIVGAIDPDEAIAEAEKHFGGWVENDATAPRLPTPTYDGGRGDGGVFLLDTDEGTTTVRYRCAPTAWTADNRSTLDVMGQIMKEQVRVHLGELDGTYSPSVYYEALSAGEGRIVLDVKAAHSDADEVFKKTLEGIQAVTETPEERIQLHQLRLARSHALHMQSTDQLSDLLAILASDDERDWDWHTTYGESLASLTREDVVSAATSCLSNGTVTIRGPADTLEAKLKADKLDFEIVDWLQQADVILEEHDTKAYKKLLKERAK